MLPIVLVFAIPKAGPLDHAGGLSKFQIAGAYFHEPSFYFLKTVGNILTGGLQISGPEEAQR